MKKILYLTRHGQTIFNLKERMQGFCDAPLTERGKKQAEIAKKYFIDNNIFFDKAYSSTSERASDTLEIITDMPYKRFKELKEWHFGDIEGESSYPLRNKVHGDFMVQFGGESEDAVRERVTKKLIDIMEDDVKSVLVVSHGAVCRVFANTFPGKVELGNVIIDNCSILKFEYEDGKFSLVEIITHDFSEI